jgi:hypothetical protein
MIDSDFQECRTRQARASEQFGTYQSARRVQLHAIDDTPGHEFETTIDVTEPPTEGHRNEHTPVQPTGELAHPRIAARFAIAQHEVGLLTTSPQSFEIFDAKLPVPIGQKYALASGRRNAAAERGTVAAISFVSQHA